MRGLARFWADRGKVTRTMLDFDAVNDSLIVGSAFVAADVPLLVELRVGAVVSLQSEAPDPVADLERAGILAARVGCEDFRAPTLGQIEEAVGSVASFVERDLRVYLHCYAGLQRAVTIAACYLIKSDPSAWNARSALDDVCSKLRNACPLREQIDAILDFDRFVRIGAR
jgi:polymorphic toxin system DSP-PTPase phosphatase-like protein